MWCLSFSLTALLASSSLPNDTQASPLGLPSALTPNVTLPSTTPNPLKKLRTSAMLLPYGSPLSLTLGWLALGSTPFPTPVVRLASALRASASFASSRLWASSVAVCCAAVLLACSAAPGAAPPGGAAGLGTAVPPTTDENLAGCLGSGCCCWAGVGAGPGGPGLGPPCCWCCMPGACACWPCWPCPCPCWGGGSWGLPPSAEPLGGIWKTAPKRLSLC
mmetsp:Transcript_26993/g.68054  ORF Transcript_26993/g.68054 Transcript_26993/m.68054 type:complete len:219 (-) Transcript_26993:167-823(-)